MKATADVLEKKPGAPTWPRVAAELGRLIGRAFVAAIALGLLLTLAATAFPAPAPTPREATSGCFLTRRGPGQPYAPAPILATEVHFRVFGVVARATVVQRFRNDAEDWVEGIYVFPLPESAAVDHLRMKAGERVIEGVIREREEARAEYERAKETGHRAALVEQERTNVFTSRVANLGPGEEVRVEIEFQDTLRFDEGEVRLRFPLVVGPRYIPGRPVTEGPSGLGWSANTTEVEDASRITPPVAAPGEAWKHAVRVEVDLDAGFPIEQVESRYHAAVSERVSESRYRVRLRDEEVPADRDFELAWKAQPGSTPRSALFKEVRGDATYALLTLFPPTGAGSEESRLEREVVYVIDTSGSMEGASIQQARQALLMAVDRQRDGERFNVIQFNSWTDRLFPEARAVTEETRGAARGYVSRLVANGGTEMAGALEAALVGSDDPKRVRQVVFLTDGSVGNEDALFGLIRQRLGDTRLFTVGIGSAPNGHFMAKAAEFGHGTFTYIGKLEEVGAKMTRLFQVLESPVLTDVEVRWPASAAVEAWPQAASDLYTGEPVVLSARLTGVAEEVVVAGRRGAEPWLATLSMADGRAGVGMAVLWARRKVEGLLDSRHEGVPAEDVKAAVVAVGLEHHIVTPHTSLVAVDVTPARPEGAPLDTRAVPLLLPAGWSHEAVFGQLPQTATPAPLHFATMATALFLAALLLRASRRRAGAGRSPS
ncbi:MAG TPA: marine proteobacterial sortase target protein [Vicinamibacteria bacterium]|nr:marine proteobacterial sortase target protein [Vicinamibacteria bacterium]